MVVLLRLLVFLEKKGKAPYVEKSTNEHVLLLVIKLEILCSSNDSNDKTWLHRFHHLPVVTDQLQDVIHVGIIRKSHVLKQSPAVYTESTSLTYLLDFHPGLLTIKNILAVLHTKLTIN